ncbi:MAG TPA: chromate resistance protein ChrB domain-containing protein [Dongiaceae bacterium]|nr:chromate resistance protein ChrB domain-containing protein [Dongiaceae bacterium]
MASEIQKSLAISAAELARTLGSARHPLVVDVRRHAAYSASQHLICGSLYRPPEQVATWSRDLPANKPVVVTCVHGHEVGQTAAAELRAAGFDARYLAGGVEGWIEAGHPHLRKTEIYDGTRATTWITRARPKIDRIACPWLIRRFIDPLADFHYVPSDEVIPEASTRNAIPFDISGVPFSHRGETCTFDSMIEDFGLSDQTLHRLARIVRGADTSRLDLTAQSAGLYAISLGLGDLIEDDHALLETGFSLYDGLYRWQRDLTKETHALPPLEVAR